MRSPPGGESAPRSILRQSPRTRSWGFLLYVLQLRYFRPIGGAPPNDLPPYEILDQPSKISQWSSALCLGRLEASLI
jgi:hypothetical protein